MAWLSNSCGVTWYDGGNQEAGKVFANVKDQLIQVVDAGSYVEDYMGYVEGDYDFDFVNDPAAMSLSVGGHVYTAQKIGDNRYGFKETGSGYAFDLTYEKGNGTTEEYFILKINEAVTKDNPVKLSYTVELANPKTAPGVYGEYDRDGSQKKGGLHTNLKAELTPVDSLGNQGETETFLRPTVSYTVLW